LHLHTIKPRVGRLRELVAELAHDYTRWMDEPNPLLDGEERAYLRGVQEAIAGLDQARVVLGNAVQRSRTRSPRRRAGGW
jgi:hypothetical protein